MAKKRVEGRGRTAENTDKIQETHLTAHALIAMIKFIEPAIASFLTAAQLICHRTKLIMIASSVVWCTMWIRVA